MFRLGGLGGAPRDMARATRETPAEVKTAEHGVVAAKCFRAGGTGGFKMVRKMFEEGRGPPKNRLRPSKIASRRLTGLKTPRGAPREASKRPPQYAREPKSISKMAQEVSKIAPRQPKSPPRERPDGPRCLLDGLTGF